MKDLKAEKKNPRKDETLKGKSSIGDTFNMPKSSKKSNTYLDHKQRSNEQKTKRKQA